MQITLTNLDRFLAALRKRLEAELTDGAEIEFKTQSHYPDPPLVEIEGQVYPYPAIGETVTLRIGICPIIAPPN